MGKGWRWGHTCMGSVNWRRSSTIQLLARAAVEQAAGRPTDWWEPVRPTETLGGAERTIESYREVSRNRRAVRGWLLPGRQHLATVD
jgi:hypothetical protein